MESERIYKLRLLAWAVILSLPLWGLLYLLANPQRDPIIRDSWFHFYIVSFLTGLVFVAALLVAVAAMRIKDARVTFLAMAFLFLGGMMVIHGLATPGAMVESASSYYGEESYYGDYEEEHPQSTGESKELVTAGNTWYVISAPWGLFLSAVFFALSAVALPKDPHPRLVVHQKKLYLLILIMCAGYGLVVVQFPSFASGLFPYLLVPVVRPGVAFVTLGLQALSVYRYFQDYRLARQTMQGAMVVGLVFLLESQLFLWVTEVWRMSWWSYHVLLLLGFFSILYGLVAEYSRGRAASEVIEGLFLRDKVEQLERGYNEAITAFIAALEAKDGYTRGHSQRVSEMAVLLGEELGMSAEGLRTLALSGLLHDVGKLAVPDSVLNKPGGLTEEEFTLIKGHPARGEAIASSIASLRDRAKIIRHHHEHYDGKGYPDGLKGDDIPLESRIIAVVDTFEALTSNRSYRPAWPTERAVAHLIEEKGQHLDPRLVDAFLRVVEHNPRLLQEHEADPLLNVPSREASASTGH